MNNKEENYKTDQKIEEAFYNYVGYHHVKDIIKETHNLNTDINNINYPESLNIWFENHIKKIRKTEKIQKRNLLIKKISGKVAILLILLVLGFGTLSLSVEAIRVKFFNFIVDVKENYSYIQIEDIDTSSSEIEIPKDWKNYYIPEYIPSSFFLKNIDSFGKTNVLFYTDKFENEIQFSWSYEKNSFQIDTESASSKKITINGLDGIKVTKGELTTILWFNQEVTYYIIGNANENELIKMAESVQRK